jgi:uncharacterized protein YndB with AHSA1/START domain
MSDVGTRAPDVSVSVVVRRTPQEVWDAVADPRRIVSWSPEAHGVSGANSASGPMAVGTTFSGSNRHGVFRWTTRCVVVESTPGEAFAFDVSYLGMSVARWRYTVTAVDDDGTHVEEQWWDTRGAPMKALGAVGTGVADRRSHNERTMRATLVALAADLEEA